MEFVSAVKENGNYVVLKTLELVEREWYVEDKKVRPKSDMIAHTAFLSFCRKKT